MNFPLGSSFIVQAPAGSGKTTLLVERFLSLLAEVDQPEEILAITFTRKAALEMKERILEALRSGQSDYAQQAAQQDQRQEWQVLLNPHRLRVMTIDAFCAQLAGHLPILSRFGAAPRIAEETDFLYQEACQHLMDSMDRNPDLQTLLAHLDNQLPRLSELLISLLKKRDQWLPYILAARDEATLREQLEGALQGIRKSLIEEGRQLFAEYLGELSALLFFAKAHADLAFDLSQPFEFLQASSFCLLTKEQAWRSRFDKSIGFPSEFPGENKAALKEMKERMHAFSENLQAVPGSLAFLQRISWAPPPHYSDAQWEILEVLLRILPLACAELRLSFQAHRAVDFTEISQGALHALGEVDTPSDLALFLDYRISHILMDEFQDTSIHQLRLLQKLVSGWEPGDGRSLFLVGDPMQSIYRFRYAEVALFLEVREEGIEQITLKPMVLRRNFRSSPALVAWFNQHFSKIFPKVDSIAEGEVAYVPSEAAREAENSETPVHYHALSSRQAEAARVVEIIKSISPTESIGILVRARSDVKEITRALKAAGMLYQAVAMDALKDHPLVMDAHSLARALFFEADRVAWLAVLRSPLIGLSLADLSVIAEGVAGTIWQRLQESEVIASLSEEGRARMELRLPVFQWAMQHRSRIHFENLLRDSFEALDGWKLLKQPEERAILETYFSLVTENMADLEARLENLKYTEARPSRIQVMTIHQSKGLEFDQVILPGLDKSHFKTQEELLRFQEAAEHLQFHLLLAPVTASSEMRKDPIYQYLEKMEAFKQMAETKRLFYVAATRAKRSLHLLAVVQGQPSKNSYLADLWADFETLAPAPKVPEEKETEPLAASTRLALSEFSPAKFPEERLNPVSEDADVLWQPKTEAMIGTVIHHCLYSLSQNLAWRPSTEILSQRFLALGLKKELLRSAITQVELAIQNTLTDPQGLWILSPHAEAQSEYALTMMVKGQAQHYIIDRTFIDEEGRRVIVDYKTSDPSESELHRPQLMAYRSVFQAQEARPVRLLLYYPVQSKLIELS